MKKSSYHSKTTTKLLIGVVCFIFLPGMLMITFAHETLIDITRVMACYSFFALLLVATPCGQIVLGSRSKLKIFKNKTNQNNTHNDNKNTEQLKNEPTPNTIKNNANQKQQHAKNLNQDRGQKKYNVIIWLGLIILIEALLCTAFINIIQASYHLYNLYGNTNITPNAHAIIDQVFIHTGLAPWSILAVASCMLGYFAYCANKPSTLSTLIPSLHNTYYDLFWRRGFTMFYSGITSFLFSAILVTGIFEIFYLIAGNLGIHNSTAMHIGAFVFYTLISIIVFLRIWSELLITLQKKNIHTFVILTGYITSILSILIISLFIGKHILTSYQSTMAPVINMLNLFHPKDPHWGIFYWAWWMCALPIAASAIAKISYGRKIYQIIIAVMAAPILLTTTYMTGTQNITYTILSHSLYYLYRSNVFSLISFVAAIALLSILTPARCFVFGFMPYKKTLSTTLIRPSQSAPQMLGFSLALLMSFFMTNLRAMQFFSGMIAIPTMVYLIGGCFCFYRELVNNKSI